MNLKPQFCVPGHQVCHSKSGEINPVKVGNLVKAYVDKYKHARKHKKGDDSGKTRDGQCEAIRTSDSPWAGIYSIQMLYHSVLLIFFFGCDLKLHLNLT